MVMDYLENILQLLVILVMQVLCLFRYIKYRKRGYVYLMAFFLCFLVSTYYWTSYLLIMGDWPNGTDLFSYLGWNIAFATLFLLLHHMKTPGERRYFHPLMLLPVPLNIYQLTLYLPYGGAANSIYQVLVMTGIAVSGLQGICWYWRKGRGSAKTPWVAVGGLLFACCEFGMWTASCFDWPSPYLNPYYYCSFLCALDYIFLVWAVDRAYDAKIAPEIGEMRERQQFHLKVGYVAVVLICCLGGLALGTWMRDVLAEGTRGLAETSVYDIIPVVLFVCSMIVVTFALAIIFLVNFGQKAAESDALREAKAVAEQSNAAKSEFLANMSHEIRTPINAMLGMNEIILRESLQARDALPDDRETIRRVFEGISSSAGNIDSAGKSLLAIINDILDFSRIEAGRLELVEGNYRLDAVLNDVCNMIEYKARAKGLEFRVDVDEALPDGLYGDEVRVRQILTNVLNNAVKYTDSGSVRLGVRGEATGADGDGIDLVATICDTGIGIRPEDMDRLFDQFERMDLKRNSSIEGTGLGLAITKKLLNLMGGGIDARSVYGEGSTFTVRIPQRVVSREPVGDFREKYEASIHRARARRERFHAPDARVLVVDDTPMNISVVAGLLKKTLISVDAAGSGAEAVERAEGTRYDMILMDQRMPGMDGTEALSRIRRAGANLNTPVICVTADAVNGARERYIAAGFTDYLTKPVDGDSLESMLLNYLPEEKVQRMDWPDLGDARTPEDERASCDPFDELRAAGIDPDMGRLYCQDDEFYRSLLAEYTRSAPEKAAELRACYAARNWNGYGIHVHALKSTSRMIGALGLSEIAERLESAAGQGLESAIDAGHGAMLAEVDAVVGAIRRFLEVQGGESAASQAADDDEILEFYPEN